MSEDKNDAVVVSLAIAHAIQRWLKCVPVSQEQKLLGLQFAARIIETAGPVWEIPVSDLMVFSNGMPSLTLDMRNILPQVK